MREDASGPSLAPLYHGPYLVLEQRDKYFRLQLDSSTDMVSVDRLKPAFSKGPISAALPPVRGQPALRPALRAPDPPPSPPSAAVPAQNSVKKGVCFSFPPPVPAQRIPRQTVCDRSFRRFSAVPSGGTPVADTLFLSFSAATGSPICAMLVSVHANIKSDYSISAILVYFSSYLLINITVLFLIFYS